MRVAIVKLGIVSVLAGCSNQQVYEALQNRERVQCQNLPPAQYEECIQRTQQSFEEYDRERNEASQAQ